MDHQDEPLNAYDRLDQSARIVAAYVSNNPVSPADLPQLIHTVHETLTHLNQPEPTASEPQLPAVPVKKSIQKHQIICLECGSPQKTLKRHLSTAHGLSADAYRSKWMLAADYPLVAPDYALRRSQLAKDAGLGRKK